MGDDNLVEDNFFGIYRKSDNVQPNRFGVVFSGNSNVIRENTVTGNEEEGVLGDGHNNVIQANQIGTKEGLCPLPEVAPMNTFSYAEEIVYLAYGTSSLVPEMDVPAGCGNGGSGIKLVHHASDNVIGGNNSNQGNTIVYNQGEGITLIGDGAGNFHSHNVIAENKGIPVNINWDNKINKGEKYVVGTNAGIPTLDFTATPLDLEEDVSGYRLKGKGVVGATAEIYLAPADGKGAVEFLEEFVIPESPFSHDLEDPDLAPGRAISALVCDKGNNCSELSPATLDRDVDHDSLLDGSEEDAGLSPWENDTDGDGLADPLEKPETAFEKDTDGDGISDFIETGGDGNYDPQGGDTDPLKADTDGDGLEDGDEDKNYNGIVELNEI